MRRVPVEVLRRFRNLPPIDRAISKIANGVIGMPLVVVPPKEDRELDSAIAYAESLRSCLRRPNNGLTSNLWSKFCWQIIEDLLVVGYAIVERQTGDDRPFYLYAANAGDIRFNPYWDERDRASPCFLDFSLSMRQGGEPRTILRQEAFPIQARTQTYDLYPRSPLEIAFETCETWLGLSRSQQDSTDQQGTPRFMLTFVGDEGKPFEQKELDQIREYWQTTVVGEKKTPILSAGGTATPLSAQDDTGLFLQFSEYLLRIAALSFNISARDLNITERDNRATAVVSADSTWQDAILPIARTITEHLWLEVVEFYAPGYELIMVDKEPRGEEAEATTAADLFERGLITRNEGRRRVGEEELGAVGNVFADGSGVEDEPVSSDLANPDAPPDPELPANDPAPNAQDSEGDRATATQSKVKRSPPLLPRGKPPNPPDIGNQGRNKMPRTKLSVLRELAAAGDWKGALRIAAKFPKLGDEKQAIAQAWEAVMRPDLQRKIGKDPEQLIEAGIAALQSKYGL